MIIFGAVVLLFLVLGLFWGMYWTGILFLEDVGLDTIFVEEIIAVSYEVDMPDGRWESQNPSEIIAVLDTLKNATFRRARKPRNPVDFQGMVWIETNQHNYGLGIISGRFEVSIDGVGRYYECSVQRAFWMELLPIMVRYEKSISS